MAKLPTVFCGQMENLKRKLLLQPVLCKMSIHKPY